MMRWYHYYALYTLGGVSVTLLFGLVSQLFSLSYWIMHAVIFFLLYFFVLRRLI